MPDLDFQIIGANPAEHALTPLIQFRLRITNRTPEQAVESVALHAQIQLQCPQRSYRRQEKDRLSELFGTPDRWGDTLRNRLWAQVNTSVRPFRETAEAALLVPCTFDLSVSSAKYFNALDGGDVGLLFLFSGSIFYRDAAGLLQVEQISWNKECTWRMPVALWRGMMEHHYPNSTWVNLDRDHFDRLYEYRRQHGLPDWDQTIDRLLTVGEPNIAEVLA